MAGNCYHVARDVPAIFDDGGADVFLVYPGGGGRRAVVDFPHGGLFLRFHVYGLRH